MVFLYSPTPTLTTPTPLPPGTGTVLSDFFTHKSQEGLNMGTAFSVLQIPLLTKLSDHMSSFRPEAELRAMPALPPLLILLSLHPSLAPPSSSSQAPHSQGPKDVMMQLIKVIPEVRGPEDKGVWFLFPTRVHHTYAHPKKEIHTSMRLTPAS